MEIFNVKNFNESIVQQSSLTADRSPSISIDDVLYDSHHKGGLQSLVIIIMVLAAGYCQNWSDRGESIW